MESPTQSPTTASFPVSNLSEPCSPKSRSRSSSRGSNLKLDLSNLPPLTLPSQPTNTLLITNLQNSDIFHPESLQNLRNIIASHAQIVTWSPLKSFRRIVCSFPSEDEAVGVRQALDGSNIMGDRVKVYFGEHTPVQPVDQHLQAPENEEPPNSQVLAEDLAKALNQLRHKDRGPGGDAGNAKTLDAEAQSTEEGSTVKPVGRTRSGSILLFEPESNEKHMPSISVDDFSDGSDAGSVPVSPVSPVVPLSTFHTARPPVELLHQA
ncbi:Calcipressin-domain-containing protein [Kalaharituber pfeilii]|nr:Calcipressin-domain-containing protein [Kalaharituber pfeilii]